MSGVKFINNICRNYRLRAASLLEAVVSAVLFLTAFTSVLEIFPRLTVQCDDVLLVAEVEYSIEQVFNKYSTGLWPCGDYVENYGWGKIIIHITYYERFESLQTVEIIAYVSRNGKRIIHSYLIECIQ